MEWSEAFIERLLPSRLRRIGGDDARRVRLIVIASVSAALMTIGLAAARFGAEGSESLVGRVLLGGAVCFALGCVWARLWGQAARAWVPAVGLLTLGVMSAVDGGLVSDAIFWIPVVPIVAAFLVGERGALAFAVLSAATLVGVAIQAGQTSSMTELLRLGAAAGAAAFGGIVSASYERGRRRALLTIERERAHSEALLAAVPDAILLLDTTGRIIDARPPTSDKDWFSVATSMDGWSYDCADVLRAQLARVLKSRRPIQRTHTLVCDEREHRCDVTMVPEQHGVVANVRDITERERLQRMQDEFVSTISHELRTPLTAVKGAIRLCQSDAVDESRRDQLLDIANRHSDRLSDLVEALLDIQRFDNRQITFEHQPVDVSQVARGSVAKVALEAEQRGIVLALELDDDVTPIASDAARLGRVVDELLANALKYSDDCSKVTVAVTQGRTVRLEVRDQGGGIPAAFRPFVFDRFTQADSSATRDQPGMGIGLTLAKRMVTALGGSIDFISTVNQGSTFWIELPISHDTAVSEEQPARLH